MQRQKVMVLGAGGFIGRACVRALLASGREVIGVDVTQPPFMPCQWIVADVLIHGLPEAQLAETDVLINLAWRNDPGRGNVGMVHDVATNVAGAVRVFEQAGRAGVRRIVYSSSGGTIYGRAAVPTPETAPIGPIGGYGAGKAAAELYLNAAHHAYGTQTCALRIANPYGPGQYPDRGQGFIATAAARTLRGQPIEIFGSMDIARDYIFIDDVADAIVAASADTSAQLILNVGSGADRTLREVIARLFALIGHETRIDHVPGRSMDVSRMVLDIGEIERRLGWSPQTSLDAGLEKTIDWLRTVSNTMS